MHPLISPVFGTFSGLMALTAAPAYTGVTSQIYTLLKISVFLVYTALLFAAAAYYVRDPVTRHSILFRMLGVGLIVSAVLVIAASDVFGWPGLLVLASLGLFMDYLFMHGAMHA